MGEEARSVISSSSGRQRRPHQSPPPQPGSEPNPTGMQPGHMRCGGGGRASPPAPQRDPAPSCPDAVTKVAGEIVSPHPRQRPTVLQRPSRGPHLAQGQEQMSGKRLEMPFVAAWVPQRPQERHSPSSLLPLCLSNSLSLRQRPRPLLQHEVIASQSQCARQTTSSPDWPQRPPLPRPVPLPERSASLWGEKAETAISGKDPGNQSRSHLGILVGTPSFYSVASPFSSEMPVPVPPPLSHRHIKERPLPAPHTVPRRGDPSPGPREAGGSDGRRTDGSLLPRYSVAGRRRGRWLRFSCCCSPRPPPLAPPSRRRWARQLGFYPVLGACALEPLQPPVGVDSHPHQVHPAPEARLGGPDPERLRSNVHRFRRAGAGVVPYAPTVPLPHSSARPSSPTSGLGGCWGGVKKQSHQTLKLPQTSGNG